MLITDNLTAYELLGIVFGTLVPFLTIGLLPLYPTQYTTAAVLVGSLGFLVLLITSIYSIS